MDISGYQEAAKGTIQFPLSNPQDAIAPMLGLASEAGAILNVYKKEVLRFAQFLRARRVRGSDSM